MPKKIALGLIVLSALVLGACSGSGDDEKAISPIDILIDENPDGPPITFDPLSLNRTPPTTTTTTTTTTSTTTTTTTTTTENTTTTTSENTDDTSDDTSDDASDTTTTSTTTTPLNPSDFGITTTTSSTLPENLYESPGNDYREISRDSSRTRCFDLEFLHNTLYLDSIFDEQSPETTSINIGGIRGIHTREEDRDLIYRKRNEGCVLFGRRNSLIMFTEKESECILLQDLLDERILNNLLIGRFVNPLQNPNNLACYAMMTS